MAAILFTAAVSLAAFCTPARAANVTYHGDQAELLGPPAGYLGYGNSVYPGSAANPLSSDNNVTVDYDPTVAGKVSPDHVMGGVSFGEDVKNNTVTIENGIVTHVYGGFTTGGDAVGNTVIVNGGAFESPSYNSTIYGGYAAGSSAIGNKVYINGGAGNATLAVYGGIGVVTYGIEPTYAVDNEIHFRNSLAGALIGGNADNCINNKIYIFSGTVTGEVYGGFGTGLPGAVTGNVVYISGGLLNCFSIYGGYSAYALSVMSGNGVVMTGGNVLNNVYGAFDSGPASLENNFVVMSAGVVSRDLVGAYSDSGHVTGNTATMSGSTVVGDVVGGKTSGGNAANNVATVTGGSVGGNVYGGYSVSGDAVGNRVEISDVNVGENVYGGRGNRGDASANTVEINGGSVAGNVYGGVSMGNSGAASGNTVILVDVALAGGIIGGESTGGPGDATGNTVTIDGGSVGSTIYGGVSSIGNATGNTVNIIGAPTLAGCVIYGGYSSVGGDATSGNTLNFMGTQTINVGRLRNFENYNFWLTASAANNDHLLTVDIPLNVVDTNVDVLLSGNCLLNEGDRIALISCAVGTGVTGNPLNDHCVSTYGSMLQYDFSIYTDGAALWAELTGGGLLPQSGALTDSRLAGSALLSQGADLVSMLEYFEVSRDKRAGYTGFAAVMGGSSTYDVGTGREIDVDGFALMAGVMWDAPLRKNSLRLRAFVEAGWSDYDTDGTYGVKHVRGDGDANYYGVGVHARYQWTDEKLSGLYTDASLRIGRIDSDFNTPDIADSFGVKAAYDTDSVYYGAHIGVGHIWKLNDRTSLDLSSKFLWTRIGSDEFTMSTGDRVELGSVNSSRWRTGLRVTREQTEQLSLFAGAYYEYEFDGDASGKIYGQYHLDKASLSGGTGIGELGLVYRPAGNDRLSAMLGVQGYVGAREGFSGRLKFEYSF